MLALGAGHVVPVSRLVEGVWGDPPPDTATTALQGHVSQLRRVLGEDAIVTRAPGYLLDVDPACVDVVRAERALAEGDPAAVARALEEWRGDPLADVADAPFAHGELPRLEELRAALCEERFEAELAAGRHVESVAGLRALVAEHPLRERPRLQLMTALHAAGRTAEALDVYADARRVLAEELGLDPGERLRTLQERILRQEHDAAPVAGAAAGPRPAASRRGRTVAAIGAALAALGAGAVALSRSGEEAPAAPAIRSGVVRIDPEPMRAAESVALPGSPSEVTASGSDAWVLDADAQTISLVTGARPRTFATGSTPIDLAADADALWVAGGSAGASQFRGPQVRSLARVDGGSGAIRGSVPLPADREAAPAIDQHARVAVARGSVWVIRADGAVAQVDARSGRVSRVLPVQAHALAGGGDGVWVLTRDGTLVSFRRGDGTQGVPVDLELAAPGSVVVGGGAVWVTDAALGRLWRVADGRPEPVPGVSAPAAIAYGHGALWLVQPSLRAVQRLDPRELRLTGQVKLAGIPRDVAADGESVWVSVAEGDRRTASCGPLQRAAGGTDGPVVVVDLPLRAGSRSAAQAMADAALGEARRRDFRAGRHRVGVRLCDDSTARSGSYDPTRCRENAEAYAADPRVVAEVGPLHSGCAEEQLGPAAGAPGGPLAIVSPSNSDPLLTRDVRPRLRGAYVRLAVRDDRLLAAAARHLREKGARTVFVLADGPRSDYGVVAAAHFEAGARAAGLRVVGRARWAGRTPDDIAARVRRARPDAVWVSGLLDNGAGEIVAALRRRVSPGVVIGGPEGLLPVSTLFRRAGAAARGVLIAAPFLPSAAEGDELPVAAYARVAMEVTFDAIARSDGSRASVAREIRATDRPASPIGAIAFDAAGDRSAATGAMVRARRGGGSVVNGSTEGADLVTVLRPR